MNYDSTMVFKIKKYEYLKIQFYKNVFFLDSKSF